MTSPSLIPPWWAVVPAAGIGRRMGGDLPKQYLPLRGRPVILHTLGRLAEQSALQGIVVAIGKDDPYWKAPSLPVPVATVEGGTERCHSVLNGLEHLRGRVADGDWVLVHDAARPCLRIEDLERLLGTLRDHPVGGLLGLPVADTVKRTDAAGEVLETIPRDGLWRALTPQMFRYGLLREALAEALAAGVLVTDEAAAVERAGYRPKMVEAHGDNIKITRPQDLVPAERCLALREET